LICEVWESLFLFLLPIVLPFVVLGFDYIMFFSKALKDVLAHLAQIKSSLAIIKIK